MEITMKEVTYKYRNKKIVQNLNLIFKEKKITTIVGPNGSGKTTILKLIIGKLKPQEGQVLFDKKNKIGIIDQNLIFKKETIKQEFIKVNDKRIKDSLLIAGLNETYLDRSPNSLSKGEKIKLALAIALSNNPKTLIIDELKLDDYNKKEFIKLIRMMKLKYNKTIIILTKNTDFAHAVSDYIYIINKGKVVIKGTKYKVFTNFKVLKENNLKTPKVIEFARLIEDKKNVKIGYRDDINDLIKDIYRSVR